MSGIVHDLAVCQHFVANDPLLAERNIILLLVYFFGGGGRRGVGGGGYYSLVFVKPRGVLAGFITIPLYQLWFWL